MATALEDQEAHTSEMMDDPDFQLTYDATDILKDEADYMEGRIMAVPWEEVKAKANAV